MPYLSAVQRQANRYRVPDSFLENLLATERVEAPIYRAHWNGHCNAIEIHAAECSGLMDTSDIR